MKRLSACIWSLALVACSGPQTDATHEDIEDGKLDLAWSRASAHAERTPWSGYWWSMRKGELVRGWNDNAGRRTFTAAQVRAFDACIDSYGSRCVTHLRELSRNRARALSPLMKFDLYVRNTLEEMYGPGNAPEEEYAHASLWEIEHHYIGTDSSHPKWESRSYAGKCIGWALSTFDYAEPTANVTISGIEFRPADIKGLLASIYNGAQFFVPDNQVVGNEFHEANDNSQAAYDDVRPHDFVRALWRSIRRGELLEGDLDPGDGVWNYPMHSYELNWTRLSPTRIAVRAIIGYADDEVGIDEVFSIDPARPDLQTRELTFELVVPRNFRGDFSRATGGMWTGDSVDTHPDVLILGVESDWRNTIYEYEDSEMAEEVNFALLRVHPDENAPFIEMVLAEYYGGMPH